MTHQPAPQPARTPRQIGALLRRHRRAKHMSQTWLGTMIGLRQATVSAIENGTPGTELRTLCDVLAVLGLELTVQPRMQTGDIESLF